MELLRGVSAANNFVLALVPLLSSQLFNSRSRPGGGGVSNAARMQKTDHTHRRLLRAASGHAAAAPSSDMNWRRLMLLLSTVALQPTTPL
jgi:hypothetical protein